MFSVLSIQLIINLVFFSNMNFQHFVDMLSFQWRPPLGFEGEVVVRSTVVEDYKTFWMDIVSDTVKVFNTTVEGDPQPEQVAVEQSSVEAPVEAALQELSMPTIDANLTEWLPRQRSPKSDSGGRPYQKLNSQFGAWEAENSSTYLIHRWRFFFLCLLHLTFQS